MKRMTLTLLLLTVNFFPVSSYSYAQQKNSSLDLADISTSVSEAKRQIALDLSRQYNKIAPFLQSNIDQYSLALDANEIFQSSGIDSKSIRQAEFTIRRAKGLQLTENIIISDPSSYQSQTKPIANLLQLRLADATMLASWQKEHLHYLHLNLKEMMNNGSILKHTILMVMSTF